MTSKLPIILFISCQIFISISCQGEKGYYSGPAARARSLFAPNRNVRLTVESTRGSDDTEIDESESSSDDSYAGFDESPGVYSRLTADDGVKGARLQSSSSSFSGVKGGSYVASESSEDVIKSSDLIQGVKGGYQKPAYPKDAFDYVRRRPSLLAEASGTKSYRTSSSAAERLQSGVKGGIRAEPSSLIVIASDDPRIPIRRSLAPIPPPAAPLPAVRRAYGRRRELINNWETRLQSPVASYDVEKPVSDRIIDTHKVSSSPYRDGVKGRVIRTRICNNDKPTIVASLSPEIYPTIQQESQPLIQRRVERLQDGTGVKTARISRTTTTERPIVTSEKPEVEELEVELISIPTVEGRIRGDQTFGSGVKG